MQTPSPTKRPSLSPSRSPSKRPSVSPSKSPTGMSVYLTVNSMYPSTPSKLNFSSVTSMPQKNPLSRPLKALLKPPQCTVSLFIDHLKKQSGVWLIEKRVLLLIVILNQSHHLFHLIKHESYSNVVSYALSWVSYSTNRKSGIITGLFKRIMISLTHLTKVILSSIWLTPILQPHCIRKFSVDLSLVAWIAIFNQR